MQTHPPSRPLIPPAWLQGGTRQAGLGLMLLARLLAGARATWTLLGPRRGLGAGFGVRQGGLLCAGPPSASGVGPPGFPSEL